MKNTNNKLYQKFISVIRITTCCLLLMLFAAPLTAQAAQASKVEIIEIDYEEASMTINPNGNTKVYYSDSKKSTWSEVEGSHTKEGYLILDLSWISDSTEYELNFKGSEVKTIVPCTLPASNKSLKVTYDKLDCMLVISEENDASTFEWRKSTTYNWNDPVIITQADKKGEEFIEILEELRLNNAKIYVRTPQEKGTSATEVGCRPSRQVLVTISKRTTAPKVTLNIKNFILSTKESMEYRVTNIGGKQVNNPRWNDADKAMELADIAPEVFYRPDNTDPKDVTIAFRTAETEKAPYSDTFYLTIPAQKKAPTEIITSVTTKTFSMQFPEASKTNVYEYCIQKPDTTFSEKSASWRSVNTTKPVILQKSSAPTGSTIRIRLRGVTQTSTKSLQLPSAYKAFTIVYLN